MSHHPPLSSANKTLHTRRACSEKPQSPRPTPSLLLLPASAAMSMFAVPQHHYSYGVPSAPTRHYSTHGTSSAFSSSAHPDEDWTKISDLAERRIQNRIA